MAYSTMMLSPSATATCCSIISTPSLQQREVLATLKESNAGLNIPFTSVEVPDEQVSLDDAVASYLFNSQLLSKADGKNADRGAGRVPSA